MAALLQPVIGFFYKISLHVADVVASGDRPLSLRLARLPQPPLPALGYKSSPGQTKGGVLIVRTPHGGCIVDVVVVAAASFISSSAAGDAAASAAAASAAAR